MVEEAKDGLVIMPQENDWSVAGDKHHPTFNLSLIGQPCATPRILMTRIFI